VVERAKFRKHDAAIPAGIGGKELIELGHRGGLRSVLLHGVRRGDPEGRNGPAEQRCCSHAANHKTQRRTKVLIGRADFIAVMRRLAFVLAAALLTAHSVTFSAVESPAIASVERLKAGNAEFVAKPEAALPITAERRA